jgi:hypothetical protein
MNHQIRQIALHNQRFPVVRLLNEGLPPYLLGEFQIVGDANETL